MGWHIAKDTRLHLKYNDLVNAVIAYHVCFQQHLRQQPKESEASHQSYKSVRDWQIDYIDPSLQVGVLNLPWSM